MARLAVDLLRPGAPVGESSGAGFLTASDPGHHGAKQGRVLWSRQLAVLVLVGETLYQEGAASCFRDRAMEHRL